MRRMGGLRKYMPVTFSTMLIGAFAIAGVPPLSGFFSKDEILARAFIGNRILWGIATATAWLTAFYMFRLMSLTFDGSYRGAQWSRLASPAAVAEAALHGTRHPDDAHAHGEADRANHEVTHGAADVLRDDHGPLAPSEGSPAITGPLMALAVGVIVAGFFGMPESLGGTNAIEHFLAPSFAGSAGVQAGHADATLSRVAALGLMLFSTMVSVAGILLARHFYLRNPGLPRQVAARWRGAYTLLLNKYYLDELYGATVVRGTIAAARALFAFDRRVVDGAVEAFRWTTLITSWFAHMFDSHVVDGVPKLVGWTAGRGSFLVRMLQTGLIQNYAMVIVLGLFAFLTVFLFAR